ncbi:MAG: PhnD/SsuA/transferrin family substrate-binding protein [Hyphomicrobiaceae bacterium]|nr:PhnD/SsuA/transferrin family substrate-binding protein [Hyphomicrobiaceae bacterium]
MARPARGLAASPGAPIRFGLTPVFLNNDLDLLARLQAYLSRSTGQEVTLVQRRTYEEITSLLLSGQLTAAWICGYPFIAAAAELSLVAVPVWRGMPLYQSYIIVDADRAATRLDDLHEDVHAFSDPNSNSGYLVTRAALAELQRRPDEFFRRSFFTYGHRNVVRAVAAGLAQSGSVDGYVWEVLSEIEPELTQRTRILRRSEWLGFPPIACLRRLNGAPETSALRQALLAMNQDAVGADVLKQLRLDGFLEAAPSLFDGIAAKIAQVRSFG